jgi:hypothetical protein
MPLANMTSGIAISRSLKSPQAGKFEIFYGREDEAQPGSPANQAEAAADQNRASFRNFNADAEMYESTVPYWGLALAC